MSECNYCASGFYLLGTTCGASTHCTNGYWADSSSRKCIECTSPCKHCTASDVCTTCIDKFFLNTTSTDTMKCKTCVKNCLECTINTCTKCLPFFEVLNNECKCSAGYYNHNGNCLIKCPKGTYAHFFDRECYICYSTCSNCSDGGRDQCTECKSTYSLITNECICSQGYFDGTSTACIAKCG